MIDENFLALTDTSEEMINSLLDKNFMSKLTTEDKEKLKVKEERILQFIEWKLEKSFQKLCDKVPNYIKGNFFDFVREAKENYPILETINFKKTDKDNEWKIIVNDRFNLYYQNDEFNNDNDKLDSDIILQKKINLLEKWQEILIYTINLFTQETYFFWKSEKSLKELYDQAGKILEALSSTGLFNEDNLPPRFYSEKIKEQIKNEVLLSSQKIKKSIEENKYKVIIKDLIIKIAKIKDIKGVFFTEISEPKWWSWYSLPYCKEIFKLKKLASDLFLLKFINIALECDNNIDYIIDNIKKAKKIHDVITEKLKKENEELLSCCCKFISGNKTLADLDLFDIVNIVFDSIEHFNKVAIKDYSKKGKNAIDLNYLKEIIFNIDNAIDDLLENKEIKKMSLILPKKLNNLFQQNIVHPQIKKTKKKIEKSENSQPKKNKKSLLNYWWMIIPVIIILGMIMFVKNILLIKNIKYKNHELR